MISPWLSTLITRSTKFCWGNWLRLLVEMLAAKSHLSLQALGPHLKSQANPFMSAVREYCHYPTLPYASSSCHQAALESTEGPATRPSHPTTIHSLSLYNPFDSLQEYFTQSTHAHLQNPSIHHQSHQKALPHTPPQFIPNQTTHHGYSRRAH